MNYKKMKRWALASLVVIGGLTTLNSTTIQAEEVDENVMTDVAVTEMTIYSQMVAENKIQAIEINSFEAWVDDMTSKRIQVSVNVKNEKDSIATLYYRINNEEIHMLQSIVTNGEFKEMYGVIPDKFFKDNGNYTIEMWVCDDDNRVSKTITTKVTVTDDGFLSSDISIPEGNRITYQLENVELLGEAVQQGTFTQFSVVPEDGYALPTQISVQMGIRILDKTEYSYSISTGSVIIGNIEEAVKIMVAGQVAETEEESVLN